MAGREANKDVGAEPQRADGDGGEKNLTSCQRFGVCYAVGLALVLVVVTSAIALGVSTRGRVDPYFSVEISGMEGLDPLRSPVVFPESNLTLRVDNRRPIRQYCREKSTVTISYSQVDMAWGELPAFCVERRSASELSVPLSRPQVLLPRQLRDRMASDMHVGKLELGVEIEPSRPQDADRPCYLSCIIMSGHLDEPQLCKQFCV
ncbi:hypothetical protein CFC21_047358 [Triticum aestivum]|uniref:Late embryogenesis abundant protein LEA-2 subgroup domain-containing protein n=2 Tax=Triticum aestivum TaxID=4565 RepID=A0A9R1K0Y4_WHEAT|nr:hypothetical protein CFC21_047358 [Triticum aestivum]